MNADVSQYAKKIRTAAEYELALSYSWGDFEHRMAGRVRNPEPMAKCCGIIVLEEYCRTCGQYVM